MTTPNKKGLALLFFLTTNLSCGNAAYHCEGWVNSMAGARAITFSEPEIGLELNQHVQDYLGLAESLGLSIEPFWSIKEIRYKYDLPASVLGRCNIYTVEYKTYSQWYADIEISPILSDAMLPAVIYHELTHCMFHKEHSIVPGSIMHQFAPNIVDWEFEKEELIEQLFHFIQFGDNNG